MSKIIKLTPQCFEEVIKDFKESLGGAKVSDGKISYTKTFGVINRKATLYFREIAWTKMQALIREFDKEVAWHGVARRGTDETKDEYFIDDIMVYPQEVTGATVNTDQEKYEMWLMQHDDEVFNNIRMQGHSHVNMGVSPSSVDTTHQEKILEQLEDDMFYIFVIWNKKNDKTIKIYDLAKNILFDTTDVDVMVIEDETGIEKFVRESKKMVIDKPITVYSGTNSKNTTYYNGYQNYSKIYEAENKATTPVKTQNKVNDKKEDKPEPKKGHRKGSKNRFYDDYDDYSHNGYGYQSNFDNYGGWD